jgi:hypothetical protein
MAVIPTLYLDGVDASTFGVWLRQPPTNWLGGAAVTAPTTGYAGRGGGVIGRYNSVAPMRLQLPITVYGTSASVREGYEQTLLAHLGEDVLVRLDDGATAKQITGRLVSAPLTPYRVPLSLRSDGTLTFVCADPTWQATTDTTETINGTPNALALGNAPVYDWVLTITATTNSITDVTITLGAYTLVWTGTIAAGQALVIDSGDFTVENNGVDALATYSGGFPALLPNASPSVSAVKGSGSGTLGGSLVYRRRWW